MKTEYRKVLSIDFRKIIYKKINPEECAKLKGTLKKYSKMYGYLGFGPNDIPSDYSNLMGHIHHCLNCVEIMMAEDIKKMKIKKEKFPCLHIAYYSSTDDGPIIKLGKKVYGIKLEKKGFNTVTVITIERCPWCGKRLSVNKKRKTLINKTRMKEESKSLNSTKQEGEQ